MQKNLTPISTPDFNTVYENMGQVLRSVPAQQRQKYVDAYLLTGDGAQKLVAAMYKDNPALMAPQQNAQAPQGTVIGNMVQQAAAPSPEEAGIAQLPADNISEESFASGGIVAFDEGGEVPGYAGPQGSVVNAPTSSWLERQVFNPIAEKYNEYIGDPLSQTVDRSARLRELQMEKARLSVGLLNPGPKPWTQETEPARQDRLRRVAEIDAEMNALLKGPATAATPAASTISGKLTDADISGAARDVAADYKGDGLEITPTAPTKKPPVGVGPSLASPSIPNISTKGLKATTVDPLTEADFGISAKPTMQGIGSLRKDAYKEAGVSEDVYKERLEDAKKRLTGIEGERKDAVANALVMAGLGIAGGRSQFALQNIAEGALPAFKEYRTDLRELRDREDKVKDSEFAVRDAQMKFRQTGADTDLKNFQDAEKDYRKSKQELATANKNIDSQNANRADEMTKVGLDVALKQAGLNIQKFSAQTQRLVATRPDLISATMGMLNQSEKFQNATGDERLEMFTDTLYSIKRTAGGAGGAGAKGFTYLNQLEKNFADPIHPIGKEYKRLYKEKGLDAAEAFKAREMKRAATAAGIQYGGGDSAAGSNVVDFNSLP